MRKVVHPMQGLWGDTKNEYSLALLTVLLNLVVCPFKVYTLETKHGPYRRKLNSVDLRFVVGR